MPSINDYINRLRDGLFSSRKQLSGIAFIDLEVAFDGKSVHDYGAMKEPDNMFHSGSKHDFERFIFDAEFVCGHNIINHDLKYLSDFKEIKSKKAIDTLFLSPLLFPKRPYHKLLKDDKLQTEEVNNPLNDCLKARDLFYDEVNAFRALSQELQSIYHGLLHEKNEFATFFDFIQFNPSAEYQLESLIQQVFKGKICLHSPIERLVKEQPVELAYSLALISTSDNYSITPPWLLHQFPRIENILKLLCSTPCHDRHCEHCESKLNIHNGLKDVFGFDEFRTYEDEPLQEKAVQAAVNGESLLAIFPTGGGKSLTFQLPAIMTGRTVHGLTVVISPLQSLMKDQVDNLADQGITDVVTINGLLDPVSRANAFDRVADGSATLLYIAPEMLRSKTLEKLLLSRNVVRFVVDEAHCFSSWGQDFRVDYLYIGDFIRNLQEKKKLPRPIPISCFTATAKQKVITDICDYFKRKLDVDLELFASSSARKNLQYSVLYAETEDEKYNTLRSLILGNQCPAIVYVSRTRKTRELAQKLTSDGIEALPFNGKMDANEKIANQNDFIANNVQVMVATSAFGMGVDKKDVGMVIHYDISDSLENYVQEAGRAGRDPKTAAKCYVLYSDHDLDKHFILLNQTKVSISEIQQVWSAIKSFTRQRKHISCSALEIAREAGWNDEVPDIETRVRTAIAALEEAGYVSRGNNVPHVFATGIMVKNMDEAHKRIDNSKLFVDDKEKQNAVRIIKSLISSKSRTTAVDDAESRVDYLADRLGLSKQSVISTINLMRQEGILADSKDMSAYIEHSENRTKQVFEQFAKLELFLLNILANAENELSFKEINEKTLEAKISSSIKRIKSLLYYLSVKAYIRKKENAYNGMVRAVLCQDTEKTLQRCQRRHEICRFVIDRLYASALSNPLAGEQPETLVQFSVITLLKDLEAHQNSVLFQSQEKYHIEEIEDALLYLSKIGALRLEGGFLVIYNAMEVHRLKEMKYRYKIEDYRMLDEFYKQKRQQIHIVGEYANMMVRDYDAALQYVQDYFQMDYKKFISKYFHGKRLEEIDRNITPEKYHKLFGTLSEKQRSIIEDKQSKYIVVAAGPGSGKTRVLIHKLASLLLLEDVKHEQLLMLTFSRAAATEFKQRLIELIGNAASFVEIKTFHAFSFDLLGKIGNLEESEDVVRRAAEMIENGEAEQGCINKAVLVIDEAQDMDKDEYALVRALMKNNEEIRVIAVGDDDQNIYEFRGSDSRYMQALIDEMQATKYEMVENYRSRQQIVSFANCFAQGIRHRMKVSPCVAVNKDSGMVQVTQYESEHLEIPLVNNVLATYSNERACILTNKNEEAARIVGLLTKQGIRAKLIQSTEGFRFSNLAEVRYFLKHVNQSQDSPVISEEQWMQAKLDTLSNYETSTCLDYIKVFFDDFEKTNQVKYRSDLMEFVFESNLEDFCGKDHQTVFVSTIHKSKGREFDTVYMLLDGEQANSDEQIRKLYVGITRAKQRLFIHCNTGVFNNIKLDGVGFRQDSHLYPLPEEITIPLTHKDVYLDYFKGKKEQILKLRSGHPLYFDNGYLRLPSGEKVASISNKVREELKGWGEKGYYVKTAKINFIVAWKGKEDKEETAVLLPELVLKKNN